MIDTIGLTGVFCVLLAYFLLQTHRIQMEDLRYSLLNCVGAALILVTLFFNFNLASFVIELCWLAISGYGLIRGLTRRKKTEDVPPSA